MSGIIVTGDCFQVLRKQPDNFYDSVVCDPPYGLDFMGKTWDNPATMVGMVADGERKDGPFAYGGSHTQGFKRNDPKLFQQWTEAWAREVFRVLKPGGHLLAFGGSRTYHRLAAGVEDAGFEIRDQIMWVYGSGFPKGHDVGKALDAKAGFKRGAAGAVKSGNTAMSGPNYERTDKGDPVTPLAAKWDGWNTALKPAHEPIVVARKPLAEGTVAGNVLKYGTGALNIDGTRVGMGERVNLAAANKPGGNSLNMSASGMPEGVVGKTAEGRWPANFILTHHPDCIETGVGKVKGTAFKGFDGPRENNIYGKDPRPRTPVIHADADGTETVEIWDCVEDCPVRMMDEQSGVRFGGGQPSEPRKMGDKGGASRFFYTAKVSTKERNLGLGELPDKLHGQSNQAQAQIERGVDNEVAQSIGLNKVKVSKNNHPTVKPISLMAYLIRLVTPPGGRVLDPFAGSGSTGCAAVSEGFSFVGIEQDSEYADIARARIKEWGKVEGGGEA